MNPATAPEMILLLEDAELDIILAKRALASAFPNALIAHAFDGAEAWEFLKGRRSLQGVECSGKPDLAVLDIRVPKVSGLELLARIRGDDELSGVKAIVMSTSDDERDIAEAKRCRADAYLLKNIDSGEFVRSLTDLARKQCSESEMRSKRPRPVLRPCLVGF